MLFNISTVAGGEVNCKAPMVFHATGSANEANERRMDDINWEEERNRQCGRLPKL